MLRASYLLTQHHVLYYYCFNVLKMTIMTFTDVHNIESWDTF